MTLPTERFTGRVADYERYRTRYPAEVIDVLRVRCGLKPDQPIADLGAGTGMLAELFLAHGNPVTAVEPNAEMRSACERLVVQYPALHVVDATAERTGLADHSVHFVSAGRAFHWFEPGATRAEFIRILRPHGWVVLVASGRLRNQDPQSIEYEHILLKHGTDYEQNRARYESYEVVEQFFQGGEVFTEEIPTVSRLSLDQFLGQTQSLSVTPQPGHAKFEGMQAALRSHFDRWAHDGELVTPHACRIVCGRFEPGQHATFEPVLDSETI